MYCTCWLYFRWIWPSSDFLQRYQRVFELKTSVCFKVRSTTETACRNPELCPRTWKKDRRDSYINNHCARSQNLGDSMNKLHMQYNICKPLKFLKTICVPVSPYSVSRINASAAGVRGVMIHLKGTGNLLRQRQNDFKLVCIYIYDRPYDSNPLVNSGFTSRVFPWSSTAGLMSYTARRRDTIKYKELSLRCLPGHILGKSPWARILKNKLDLPTGVQTQIPQSLGPSHSNWVFRPSDTVQAGIPWGR